MKKYILPFLLLFSVVCHAASSSGGGCRSSFSSIRSSSFSSVKSSGFSKTTSFSTIKSSSSVRSFKYTPLYSSYRSYGYRPYYSGTFNYFYYPSVIYSPSPFNNMWFWMYMMNHNNNIFQSHDSAQNWDGNSNGTDTNSDDDKAVTWAIIGICVFVAVVISIAIFN